jgi:hypothetical protein
MENSLSNPEKTHQLETIIRQFEENLLHDFNIENLSTKLKNWHTLEWTEFKKEILKSGEKLNYNTQSVWHNYFVSEKEKVKSLAKEMKTVQYTIIRKK